MSLVGQKINEFIIVERKVENVFLGRDEVTKREVIVKTLYLGNDFSQQKAMDADIKIGMRISKSCIFLVRYEEAIIKDDVCYLVMEYCSMGDLAKIIADRIFNKKPFSDEEIFRILFHVGKAVEALHKENMAHRDLKPSNIFVAKGEMFKVGDYGIARSIDPSSNVTTLLVASIGYAPPEIMDGDSTISKAMDIYSLGCIILELIDLCHPFANEKNMIQQSRVFGGKVNAPNRPLNPTIKSVRDLAVQMVSVDPAARPPIESLLNLPAMLSFLVANDPTTPILPPPVEITYIDYPTALRGNPKGGCAFESTDLGEQCVFTNTGGRTVFLKKHNIIEGVYQWTVKIKYGTRADWSTYFNFGGARSNRIGEIDGTRLCHGGWCFNFARMNDGTFVSTMDGVSDSSGMPPVPNKALVTVEADPKAGTLSFFVDNKKIPHCISGVSFPLDLGMSAYNQECAFYSVSLRRLSSPTPPEGNFILRPR